MDSFVFSQHVLFADVNWSRYNYHPENYESDDLFSILDQKVKSVEIIHKVNGKLHVILLNLFLIGYVWEGDPKNIQNCREKNVQDNKVDSAALKTFLASNVLLNDDYKSSTNVFVQKVIRKLDTLTFSVVS